MTTQRANVLLGFTVVILTITLVIPIIGSLRAQSDRTETVNRLKNIVLGLHNYESTYKCLPPAFDKSKSLPTPASVHVHLLQFLGEDKLWQTFHSGQGNDQAVVLAFLAPSDGTLGSGAGVQNFAANLRLFSNKGRPLEGHEDMPQLSPIEPGGCMVISRIGHGASSTIAFATKLASCGAGGSHYAADPTSPFAAFFGQNHAEIPADPKDPMATFQLAPRGTDCCVSPLMAQSFDRKEMLLGLADASVRSVTPALGPEKWNHAISPYDE